MHLRPPSIDHGTVSFIWAVFFFLILWLGALSIGVSKGTAIVVAAVAGFVIFLLVRIYGEDEPTRP